MHGSSCDEIGAFVSTPTPPLELAKEELASVESFRKLKDTAVKNQQRLTFTLIPNEIPLPTQVKPHRRTDQNDRLFALG